MDLATILQLPEGIHPVSVTLLPALIRLEVTSTRSAGPCPRCGTLSNQVHSSYTRTVADVPCAGRQVRMRWRVQRFRCANHGCPQRIFTERLPTHLRPWARKTFRLGETLRSLGMSAGGRGAQVLARRLGMAVSPQTVLRLVMAAPEPTPALVTVLGVDDFALRRGQTYATMLVDLEQHRVVDLFPERSEISLAQWLRQHPGVRLISRDRAGDYASGAALGAPQAEQIADRFHLLVNAGEVLERCLRRYHASLREAAQRSAPADAVLRATKHATPADVRRKQDRHAAREQHFKQVVALTQHGVSAHEIARRLGIARQSVATFLRVATFPELALHSRPRQLDRYLPYLRERWNAGEHNVRQLWREIRDQGYTASDRSLRRLLSTWRLPAPQPGVAGTPLAPKEEVLFYSTHKTRWLLMKAPADLSAREAAYVAALTHLCPPIAEAQRLLTAFCYLLTARHEEGLDPWLEQCEQSGISELVGFARGLRRDYAAVYAAVRYEWSQGPVEGHINRLKMRKRQMYGRASFSLLRRRVLPDLAHPP
jgi:transposase